MYITDDIKAEPSNFDTMSIRPFDKSSGRIKKTSNMPENKRITNMFPIT